MIEERYDESQQATYYYNPATGKSAWTRAEVEDPVQPSNSPLPPTDLQASDPAPAPVDDDYAGPSDAAIVTTAGSDQPAVAVSEVM